MTTRHSQLSSRIPSVVLVSNTCWYLFNFRLPLLRALRANGYRVTLVAPYDDYTPLLLSEGFVVHHWILRRSSINPLRELKSLLDLISIYRTVAPDIVHHFTIKACLYGTIAAKVSRIYAVINAVTGLGHLFLGSRNRNKILRYLLSPFYKAIFTARRSTVVFQNSSDQETLIKLGIASGLQSQLIRGSGVDITHFTPNLDNSGCFHDRPRLLFPSRLIKEKGIEELISACQLIHESGIDFELSLAGDLDPGNRSSISPETLEKIRTQPYVKLLGHVDDMKALYMNTDIVVLPSWREGLSRALVEAAAMERPIVTTDVPGCNDVVQQGVTGLLVPAKSAHSLYLAVTLLLKNSEFSRKLGKAARNYVISNFQVNLVNKHTLEQYRQISARIRA